MKQRRHFAKRLLLGFCLTAAAAIAQAADPAPAATPAPTGLSALNEAFDSMDGFAIKKGYRCVRAEGELDLHEMKEGAAALKTTWEASEDQYGIMEIVKKVPETDITGARFELWVKPLNDNGVAWGVLFYDADGKLVEDQRIFILSKDNWHQIQSTVGTPMPKGLGTYYKAGDGDPKRVTKVVLRVALKKMAEPGMALWDGFRVTK